MDAVDQATYIRALVDDAPPLTREQSENISALLRLPADGAQPRKTA